ncbi:MAG TPA: hypothetical protein VMW10_05615 [Alphaproteobacteria bacterium]|nr:hypothetical protein [Alphaproteobacteria bacterium]
MRIALLIIFLNVFVTFGPTISAVNFDGYNPEQETGAAKFHIIPDGIIEKIGREYKIDDIPPLEYSKSIPWGEIGFKASATFFRDGKYVTPTHEHLEMFINWWRGFILTENVAYIKDAFDCDNFANLFKTLYTLSSLRAEEKVEAQVLVGTIIVKQEKEFAFVYGGSFVWHMLNIVRTEKGWFVVEPQNGFFISLEYYPNSKTIVSAYF